MSCIYCAGAGKVVLRPTKIPSLQMAPDRERDLIVKTVNKSGVGPLRNPGPHIRSALVAQVAESFEPFNFERYNSLMEKAGSRWIARVLLVELFALSRGHFVKSPYRKPLAAKIGVTFQTLKRAFEELIRLGLISQVRYGEKRGYQLFPLNSHIRGWRQLGGPYG